MLSAARLPLARAESLHLITMFGELKSSIKKEIIVRRTVRSMFGEQTFAQLRTGLAYIVDHAVCRKVRAEACISLQASWEQENSSNCPN